MKAKQNVYKRLTKIMSNHTYRETADQLNSEGYRTPQGKKWNKQHIATWAFNQRKATSVPVKAKTLAQKQVSVARKLFLIKQIVMGLHQ